MTQRRSFDKDFLHQEFEKLSSRIDKPVTMFLIGGGGLAFYGLKVATKDMDIILNSADELTALTVALESLNYKKSDSILIARAYNKMQASNILENDDGFRWDLFVRKVCNALTLSDDMKSRAKQLWTRGKLKIQLASKEDIFLFKGITEREADLDDMRLLAESGLDWKIIVQECQNQSTFSGRLWENALLQKLLDLREKHHIVSPIEKLLRTGTEKKLIDITLIEEIKKENNTIKSIAQAIKEPQSFVRKELKRLAEEDLVKVDKSHRPHKFYLNARNTKHTSDCSKIE